MHYRTIQHLILAILRTEFDQIQYFTESCLKHKTLLPMRDCCILFKRRLEQLWRMGQYLEIGKKSVERPLVIIFRGAKFRICHCH